MGTLIDEMIKAYKASQPEEQTFALLQFVGDNEEELYLKHKGFLDFPANARPVNRGELQTLINRGFIAPPIIPPANHNSLAVQYRLTAADLRQVKG